MGSIHSCHRGLALLRSMHSMARSSLLALRLVQHYLDSTAFKKLHIHTVLICCFPLFIIPNTERCLMRIIIFLRTFCFLKVT